MEMVDYLRDRAESDRFPILKEINALCQIIQGISLVTLGNFKIHQIGLSKVCHQSIDENKVCEASGQILSGYRLIKAGIDTNLPLIATISTLALLSFLPTDGTS